MRYSSETRTNYDNLSQWYDALSASSERPLALHGLQMLDAQPGERILEIGCGTGASLPDLATGTGSTGQILGFDLSRGMLNRAREKLGKHSTLSSVQLLQGDAYRLPLASETLDAIFLSFTLELFPTMGIPLALQGCLRVLRRTGRIAIVSLLQKDPPGTMERAYNWAHRRWPHVIDCRPIPWENMVKSAGFVIRRKTELSMWGLAVGVILAVKG